MKHVCVATRIVDEAKADGANVSTLALEADKVSDDSGRNPGGSLEISTDYPGLARVWPMASLSALTVFEYGRRQKSRPEPNS
jgi:hypothetical protein